MNLDNIKDRIEKKLDSIDKKYLATAFLDVAKNTELNNENLLKFILNADEHNCFIIYDPDRKILQEYYDEFIKRGLEVNIVDFDTKSAYENDEQYFCHYNPFDWVRSEEDLTWLMSWIVDCFEFQYKKYKNQSVNSEFINREKTLLKALGLYLIKYCPYHQRTLESVGKLLRAGLYEDDCRRPSLDRLFEDIADKDLNYSEALEQYKDFLRMVAGDFKEHNKVINSCLSIFNAFTESECIKNLTKNDTIRTKGFDYDFGNSVEPTTSFFIRRPGIVFIIPPKYGPAKQHTFMVRELLTVIFLMQLTGDMRPVDKFCSGERFNLGGNFANATFVINDFAEFNELPYANEILKRIKRMVAVNFNGGK